MVLWVLILFDCARSWQGRIPKSPITIILQRMNKNSGISMIDSNIQILMDTIDYTAKRVKKMNKEIRSIYFPSFFHTLKNAEQP